MADCKDLVDISLEDSKNKLSQPFCCPISKKIMIDPVILVADFQTYDKSNLEQWFKMHGRISPISKEPLETTEFIPNLAIKTQIDEYNEEKTKTDQKKFQSYFSNISTHSNTSNAIRLLLIGDCNVGKSSVKRFIEFNNADPGFIQPTLGIDSAYVHFKQSYTNDDIIVQITDICGQDRFRSLTRQCYRHIHGVILVCSLDCPDSVMNLKGAWCDDVFENAPDDIYGIVLVNKCDLLHSSSEVNELKNEKITKYETLMRSAVQFANCIQYPIYCTSTITGEYIHAAFADIVYRISKDTLMWDMIQHNPLRTGNIRLVDKPPKVVGVGSGGCVCVMKSVWDFGHDQIKKKLNESDDL